MDNLAKFGYIFLAAFMLITGCSVNKQTEPPAENAFEQAPSEVVYNPPSQSELYLYAVRPDTFNPLLTQYQSNRDVFSLIYDPLVSVAQDYNLSFKLAENFIISDNGLKLTLTLKRNVRWHDGSTFSAADVEYTIKELSKTPESVYYNNLNNVKSSKAVNSFTYEFILNSPDSGFIYLLNFPIIKNSSSDILKTKDAFKPVGTGMYSFGDYAELKSFILSANNSWLGGNINIHKIIVNLLPDTASSYNGFKMNSMNSVIVSHDNSGKYSANDNIKSISSNTNTYAYISVNHSNTLLKSPALRKILKRIVSTSKITHDIIPEFTALANSPINPAAQFSLNLEPQTDDIKELLSREGYIQNNKGIRTKVEGGITHKLEFDLLINKDNPTRVITGEYIANALSIYGITINIIRSGENEYFAQAASNRYDLVLCETNISLNNNLSFLLASDGEMNFGRYSAPEMDEVLSQIKTSNDLNSRAGYLQKLQTIFNDTMPHIPLYFLNKKILYNSANLSDVTVGAINNEYSNLNTWNLTGKENKQ